MLRPCSKSRACPACAASRDRAGALLFRCLLIVFVSAALAFIPLDYCNDAKSQFYSGNGNVSFPVAVVRLNEALADTIDEYNSFLDEMAEQAGMTPAEYIATITGVANVTSGYNFVKDGGLVGATVSFSNTTADNLSSLVDAGDYPSWDTLTSEVQASWGTQEKYETAKFNSLMDAFGLGDARDRFYASGGGNFEWYNDELEKLQTIGDIGSAWANGLACTFGQAIGITKRNELANWLGNASLYVDGSNVQNWPSSFPSKVPFSVASVVRIDQGSNTTNYYHTSREVYNMFWTWGDNQFFAYFFDKATFKTGYGSSPDVNPSNNPSQVSYNGHSYFSYNNNKPLSTPYTFYTPLVNVTSIPAQTDVRIVIDNILFGDAIAPQPNIEDYPDVQPQNNLSIYFPGSGATYNNTWNDYTTPSEPTPEPEERPENPYNPGNQTGSDDWKDETEENVLPLLNIKFDELFPFSMLYDIPRLFEKVQATAPEYGEYDEIIIPVDLPGNSMDTTLVIDLENIASLGVMIRPFIQILLAAALLIVTIRFWQGVITG